MLRNDLYSSGHTPPPGEMACRALYREMAGAVREDCLSIDRAWLLNHADVYERIKALDDRLSMMERKGAGELEYRVILARLVALIRDARALQAREQAGARERPM